MFDLLISFHGTLNKFHEVDVVADVVVEKSHALRHRSMLFAQSVTDLEFAITVFSLPTLSAVASQLSAAAINVTMIFSF